jgi:hypothetical protein
VRVLAVVLSVALVGTAAESCSAGKPDEHGVIISVENKEGFGRKMLVDPDGEDGAYEREWGRGCAAGQRYTVTAYAGLKCGGK